MKLSLLPLLSLVLVACSSDPAPDAPPPPGPPSAATAEQAPAGPPARTLVTKRIAPTPAENLLVDPEFQSLWAPLDETGFGVYESFVQDGAHSVRFEPRTPVGPGFGVLSVAPSSAGATLTMTVLGGKGPLSVRVWVAAKKGAEPSIELVSLYDDAAVTLAPDESSRTTIGEDEWVELVGTSTGDMPGMLYLVGAIDEPARFAAPRVLSGALPPKSALPSRAAPSPRAASAARNFRDLRSRYVTKSPPPRPSLAAQRPR